MKQLSHKFTYLFSTALSAVVALMGFGSCRHHTKEPQIKIEEQLQPIRLMYGPPVTSYRVAGRVTMPDGEPDRNAEVKVYTDTGEGYVNTESLRTDYDGRFIGNPTRLSFGSAAYLICEPGDTSLRPDTLTFDPAELAVKPSTRLNISLRKK